MREYIGKNSGIVFFRRRKKKAHSSASRLRLSQVVPLGPQMLQHQAVLVMTAISTPSLVSAVSLITGRRHDGRRLF